MCERARACACVVAGSRCACAVGCACDPSCRAWGSCCCLPQARRTPSTALSTYSHRPGRVGRNADRRAPLLDAVCVCPSPQTVVGSGPHVQTSGWNQEEKFRGCRPGRKNPRHQWDKSTWRVTPAVQGMKRQAPRPDAMASTPSSSSHLKSRHTVPARNYRCNHPSCCTATSP